MSSALIITPVEKMQEEINKAVRTLGESVCIYVSLNKTQKSIEQILKQNKINTEKIFFIDCVTSEKTKDDVLHISPKDVDKLAYAIQDFISEIKSKKSIIIDALSTLLIYNDENKVAAFIKNITEYSSQKGVDVVAFSPITKGEELLNKIFNFFDKVKKEENETKTEKRENLIY
jgi:archaellum biogenesis ATPase FlaH